MKNMGVVNKLVSRSMRDNKTRNFAAILAIALTAIMFTTVFTVGMTMLSTSSMVGVGMGADAIDMLVGAAVVALILGSGYLIIYNIFHISVTQDIQYYGRLKTLGTSDKQIQHMVFSQALRLSAIGIPVGLAMGYGIGALLIPVVLVSFGAEAALTMNPLIFIAAAVFSLLTVFLSCAKPAATAGKVSPVTAMKYTDSDTKKAKIKTHMKQAPTTPRRMAKNNLKRNKKRTSLVVISITLGLALMNSFYVYQHSFDERAYVNSFIQSDISVSGSISPEIQQGITEMPGVVQANALYYTEAEETINPVVLQRITAFYDEEESGQRWWIENEPDALRQYQGLKQTGATTVSIYGLDADAADMGSVYLGRYDAEKFATGKYIIGFGNADNGEGSEHYDVGDTVEIQGREYQVMALVEPTNTIKGDWHSDQNQMGIDYAIHIDSFLDSFPEASAVALLLETSDDEALNALTASLSEMYPELDISSKHTFTERFKSQTLAITAMGYALGVLTALIGIVNFANTMLTAIVARKHEFTMMESIGMTKKQLKSMLVHEGVRYVVISIVLSIGVSALIAATIIEEAVATSWVASYNFTLAPFAVIAPILLVLAIAIPLVCFRGTQKQSLVERLRNA